VPFPLTSEKRIAYLSSARIERYLDRGAGACHLRDPEVANAVSETLSHFDEKRYRLFAWCIMPNHVHVVVRLFPGSTLAAVLHSWKSFAAKRVMKLVRVQGSF
jgi:Transposase IS200 like